MILFLSRFLDRAQNVPCQYARRRYIGFDVCQKHVDTGNARCKNEAIQPSLFEPRRTHERNARRFILIAQPKKKKVKKLTVTKVQDAVNKAIRERDGLYNQTDVQGKS